MDNLTQNICTNAPGSLYTWLI